MRITPTPAIGLLAAHTALVTGVHGITGDIVGTSDSQLLTNKIFRDELFVENPLTGTGAFVSPKLTFMGAYNTTKLQMSMYLVTTSTATYKIVFLNAIGSEILSVSESGDIKAQQSLLAYGDVKFRSATEYYLTMQHTLTAARTVTWPDKNITVAGTVDISDHAADTSTHGVAQVANYAEIASQIATHAASLDHTIIQQIPMEQLEVSVGAPALTNETGTDQSQTQWRFDAADERIRTPTTFSPPAGFNKLKIQALLLGTNEANEFEFSYALDGGAVTSAGVWQGDAIAVATSSEIAVADTELVRLFLEWNSATQVGYCYGFKLLWYK